MRIPIPIIAVLICARLAPAQTPDELHKMLDANQYFALRDAVEHGGANVPVFYRGAVEASLNEIEPARKDLEQAIHDNPQSKNASNAREMLANMASRNGLYTEALRWIEEAHAATPDSQDINNTLPAWQAFAQNGDMKVLQLASTTADCKDGFQISINGRQVTYGFDTGGQQSVMGEADAKMLGLRVTHVETKMSESSGSAIPGFDIAIARDFVIGGLHLQNVGFLVLKDSGEPFVHIPVGQRGLIGLPVLIAMQTVQWSPATNKCRFGPAVHRSEPGLRNLLFNGATPIVQLTVQATPLTFSLDTGAKDTDLNQGFATALPDLVKAGKKETRPITGYGGTDNYDSVLLGPVVFHVGSADITLKSPHVFPNHSLGKFDGNLGNDILDQAKTVTLDFVNMELKLE